MPEGRQELPGTYKKQKQDISESFYKFEIRTLLDENETKSVISGNLGSYRVQQKCFLMERALAYPIFINPQPCLDSWSTDVVASDFSEPPESSQMERLEEIAEEVLPQGLLEVAPGKRSSDLNFCTTIHTAPYN